MAKVKVKVLLDGVMLDQVRNEGEVVELDKEMVDVVLGLQKDSSIKRIEVVKAKAKPKKPMSKSLTVDEAMGKDSAAVEGSEDG